MRSALKKSEQARAEVETGCSIGQFLQRKRIERELSLGDLSRATKIKELSLAALEQDRFDALPAPIFVLGFVSAYARAVGADETEARELLRKSLPQPEAEIAPVLDPEIASESGPPARGHVALVVFLLLLVATITLSVLLNHDSFSSTGLS